MDILNPILLAPPFVMDVDPGFNGIHIVVATYFIPGFVVSTYCQTGFVQATYF